jgi:hypothetical protein
MTTRKAGPLVRIGPSHIRVSGVKSGNDWLWDIYYKGTWLGSARTIKQVRERVTNYINKRDDKECVI